MNNISVEYFFKAKMEQCLKIVLSTCHIYDRMLHQKLRFDCHLIDHEVHSDKITDFASDSRIVEK